MKGFWVIAILFGLGIVALTGYSVVDASQEFDRLCREIGGKPAHDGRQHVCFKETK